MANSHFLSHFLGQEFNLLNDGEKGLTNILSEFPRDMLYMWLVVYKCILELMQQYVIRCSPQKSSGIFSKLLLTKFSKKPSVFNFQIFLYKWTKHEGSFSSLLSVH